VDVDVLALGYGDFKNASLLKVHPSRDKICREHFDGVVEISNRLVVGTPALENQKSIVSEGKVNPTSGSGIAISLSALQSGNSRSGVSEFKALVNVNQGQKAYSEAS
jgi:hypothetical protein